MATRGRRIALAMCVAALTGAWAICGASASPVAISAAGNSMTATGTVDATYDPSSPTARITGQILASGHKYGPRHCLALRDIFASTTTLSGAPQGLGDADRPTDKRGRFVFSQIELKYGNADNNGLVPISGGYVTVTLSATPATAPKRRGDITNSFHCQPVSTTVSLYVPHAPPGFG